jgi:hypothetical protein
MNQRLRLGLAAGLLLAAGAAAAGTVEVSYVQPERFSDIGFYRSDKDNTLAMLKDYLGSLGARLPADETLKLSISDVDLAGEMKPIHHGTWTRIVRDRADWPRITLHYSLERGGQVLRSGDEVVQDMAYRESAFPTFDENDPLRYEKRMLDKWFKSHFTERQAKR